MENFDTTQQSVGTIRKIDTLGRIVLTKEYRDYHAWDINQKVEMINYPNGIFVKTADNKIFN